MTTQFKTFHSEAIGRAQWRDAMATENGQPLACWWGDAEASYKEAGRPAGALRVRHRMVSDLVTSGTHDGIRDGSGGGMVMVCEVGTI